MNRKKEAVWIFGILVLLIITCGLIVKADTVDSYTTNSAAPSSPASGWYRFDDTANTSKFYFNNLSAWGNGDTNCFYGGSIHANGGSLSNNSNPSYVGFQMSGTRFALINQTCPNRNQNIQVYIDGSYVTTFSASQTSVTGHYVYYISPALSDSYHYVWLVGPSYGSSSTEMNFDGIDIKDSTRGIGLVSAATPSISAPTISPSRTGWGTSNVTVSLSGSSDTSKAPSSISYKYSIDNGSYQSYSSSFTVSGNGSHTVKAYATDTLGYTSSTSSITFGIDTVAPSVSASEVATWSNTSATINTSISDSYSGINTKKWASGSQSASYFSSSGTTFTGTSFTVTADGTYTVYAKDNAGNTSVKTVAVSHIDTTAPSGSYSLSPSTNTSGSVTITVNATDSGSGVASITDPGGTVHSGSSATYSVSANGTYNFTIKDTVGNSSVLSVPVANIDKTAPAGTYSLSPSSYTSGNVTITVTATDTGSGVASITDPGGTVHSDSSATYSVSANGTYNFAIMDNVGNTKTLSVPVNNIDKTAPSGSYFLSPSTSTSGSVTITVTGSDTQSGVASIKAPDGNVTSGSSATYSVSSNGTYPFIVYDAVGNSKEIDVPVSNIDKTAPSGGYSLSTSSFTSGSVTITITATDSGSGVASITDPGGTVHSSTSTAYSVSTNGTYSFTIKDNAGNATELDVPISNIDKTAPTGSFALSPDTATPDNVTITVTATDSESGVASITDPEGTATEGASATYVVSANGTYSFTLKDSVGNVATYSVPINNIDRQVSVTHPITASFSINPNQIPSFVCCDLPITNNSEDIQMKVSVSSFSESGTSLHDVLPTKFSNWTTLSASQTTSNIALGLKVKEAATSSSGWSQIDQSSFLYSAQISALTQLGILNPLGNGNLTFNAYTGKAWNESMTDQHSLVLQFDIAN